MQEKDKESVRGIKMEDERRERRVTKKVLIVKANTT